jgi:hypothetical protein
MPQKKRVRGNPSPLIIEDHPASYLEEGHPFITLIQHRNQHILTIVDNADDKTIKAFVLDLCGPEHVDEEKIITTAATWYYVHKQRYPLSIEFSRLGMTPETSKIYRTYNTEFVTRVIGPLPKYEMEEVASIRRRRRKALPPGVEIHKKTIKPEK